MHTDQQVSDNQILSEVLRDRELHLTTYLSSTM